MSIREHHLIADAFQRADAGLAAALLRSHLERTLME